VTNVCLGSVATNVARDMKGGAGMSVVLAVFKHTLQRTPEQGADAVVCLPLSTPRPSAPCAGEESN
jgi:hypothetical protein